MLPELLRLNIRGFENYYLIVNSSTFPYHHLPSEGTRGKPFQWSIAALGRKSASYDLA